MIILRQLVYICKRKKTFELIYSEECKTRPEARVREKYWKSGIGKEKLNKLRNSLK